ncbi:MAG: hypothetical protein D5R98_08065 [Desulfonatronovibrio sp. MSAO_Bac4]|nr:MAG: hypothetical protein D5R98_08065 [Desulfonatronovibrio sp. MSAO_Bac4]
MIVIMYVETNLKCGPVSPFWRTQENSPAYCSWLTKKDEQLIFKKPHETSKNLFFDLYLIKFFFSNPSSCSGKYKRMCVNDFSCC